VIARNVLRALADHVHVRLVGVHVRARSVDPSQRRNEIPVAQKQGTSLLAAGDRLDCKNGLTAAERKPCNGQLSSHGRREPHCVFEALRRRGIHLHPGAASCWAETRRVQAYEDPGATLGVAANNGGLPVPVAEKLFERRLRIHRSARLVGVHYSHKRESHAARITDQPPSRARAPRKRTQACASVLSPELCRPTRKPYRSAENELAVDVMRLRSRREVENGEIPPSALAVSRFGNATRG
jgi:hypothetical protein